MDRPSAAEMLFFLLTLFLAGSLVDGGQDKVLSRVGVLSPSRHLHGRMLRLRGAGPMMTETGEEKSQDQGGIKPDPAPALWGRLICTGCSNDLDADSYTPGCGHTLCAGCLGLGPDGPQGCSVAGCNASWVADAKVRGTFQLLYSKPTEALPLI